MTEAEWLACRNPDEILEGLHKPTRRKLLLFAVACRRLNWTHIGTELRAQVEPDVRAPLDAEECFADGLVTARAVAKAWREAGGPDEPDGHEVYETYNVGSACLQAEEAAEDGAYWIAGETDGSLPISEDPWYIARERLQAAQCDLARDIFRYHSRRPSLTRDARMPAVLPLAQAAYDERLPPSGHLDPARLAVLSDALEEAGCTDAGLLGHLRSPGPHVRGCWALDLVLGKG